MGEGNTRSSRLKCKLNLPILCRDHSVTDCDMKIWLNYKQPNGFNRVVTKECIEQSNGARSCDSCNKSYKKETNILKDDDRVQEWDLNVNMESKNLNNQNEAYEIEIKTNNNSINLRPIYKNLIVPTLNVDNFS